MEKGTGSKIVPGSAKLGILVGGGPAPGINSVIAAATIRADQKGIPVIGIVDGFRWLIQEDIHHTIPLKTSDVSRIHFLGGSHLGTSRDNPTQNPKHLEAVSATLKRLNIHYLITIGGDDTLYSAYKLAKHSGKDLHVVHVPKTIDNDINLPNSQSTFGFQTARHLGVQLVKNLMNDATSTHRWYFVIAMGRKAGHLALGIGKAAGATITLIPEEFETPTIPFSEIVDTLVGAIIKRMTMERDDGVAVIAEGLMEHLDPKDLAELEFVERDAHGHIRLSEINFGEILKRRVQEELKKMDIVVPLVATDIGYELRCADPIPFDIAYTRDLGFLAANHVLSGGNSVVISVEENQAFRPIAFDVMMDQKTGRSQVRMVNPRFHPYQIAYAYMIRLKPDDFASTDMLQKLANVCHLSTAAFAKRFGYLMKRAVHQTAES